MGWETVAAIIGSVTVVCGSIFGALKYFKKPDETWKEPFADLERKMIHHEKDTTEKLNKLTQVVTKLETHVEGIAEIKRDLNRLDSKIEKLTNTIIEWISKK